jgi:hypothetical protein
VGCGVRHCGRLYQAAQGDRGLLFGPVVWSTAYLVLPPTGIYQSMRHYDAKTLWKDASAHLAYGVGTAAIFKLLARRR